MKKQLVLKAGLVLCVAIFPLVAQQHEWNAKQYSQNSSRQEKVARKALAVTTFEPTDSILDIGCGDGKVTQYIAKNAVPQGTCHGIDKSESMIEFAQQEFKNLRSLTFQVADAQLFDLAKTFDKALCFNVLHWIKDKQGVVNNVYKHLKPGGQFIAFCVSGNSKLRLNEVITQTSLKQRYNKYAQYYLDNEWCWFPTISEFETLLSNSGFVDFEVVENIQLIPSASRQTLADSYKAWLPHKDRMPEELFNQFALEIVDRYTKILISEGIIKEGEYGHVYQSLQIRATK